MKYQLPIYDISIEEAEHLGVREVAFVEDPAIQELWVAMANEEIKLSVDNDKMIVTGPALVPDRLIYRVHPKTGAEYYIRFSKEVIQSIVQRYFTQNRQIAFNLQHNTEDAVQGVILESWIVKDPTYDQSVLYGFKNIIPGTWFISVKVEDETFWKEYVKTGKTRGFSIEGAFAQELAEQMSNISLVEPHKGEHQDEFINRCVAYHIDKENMNPEQATAICYTKWDEKLRAGERVSFDFDGTLSTRLGRELARRELKSGSTVYVISARNSKAGMLNVTDALGIPSENVFATGSNLAKVEKIKQLKITKHFDNNRNIKRMLPKGIGVNFSLTEEEAEILIKSILMAEDSYTDYPEAAKEAAARGIKYNEENGNKCATQVGKVRAQQIANGEPLSYETLKRTYSFLSRAKEYYNPDDKEACGTISYLLWGGEPMLNWVERKLKEIEAN